MKHSHTAKNIVRITTSPALAKIRIASLNAQCGKKLDRIISEFNRPKLAVCDLILLQEIEEDDRLNQAEALAARLGYIYTYMPARATKRGTHGLAILSKHPLSDIERLDLPRNELLINTRDRMAMGATVSIGGKKLRI